MDWKFYIKEFTWLIILVAMGFGLLYPNFGLAIQPYLSYLLMILMFLSCVNIEFVRAWKHLKKIRKIVVSMLIIFVCSPLILLFFRKYFNDEIFLGMIIASVAPAGMSVVFLAKLLGGSDAKSLVIMFLSNLLAILMLPLLVWFFANTKVEIDVMSMLVNTLKLVMVPLVLAMFLRKYIVIRKIVESDGAYFSVIILFLLVIGVVSSVRSVILADINQSLRLTVLVTFLVLINFYLGMLLGSDTKAKITYAISNSYKNFTLTTVIALSLFNPTVALPSVVYTLVNNLLIAPAQWWFKNRR